MRHLIPAVLVLMVPAALSAQAAPRLAPQNSVLFARVAEPAPAEGPSTGFKPYSWPRALLGAAFGTVVGGAIAQLRTTGACDDCDSQDQGVSATPLLVGGAILGFIIGGRTGKPSEQ